MSTALFACKTIKPQTAVSELNGTWELIAAPGSAQEFNKIYPENKPTMVVNTAEKSVGGNSSCNNYSTQLVADNGKISFKEPIAATKMLCYNNNNGEMVYFQALDKVDAYTMTNKNTLNLLSGDKIILSFTRK